MIGQFGILPLLLSAPIVAIAVDLVRYFHGRLSEPARPAGVLPGAAVASGPAVRPVSAALHPVRSVYRAATVPPPLLTSAPPSAAQPVATTAPTT
jgi:hypothetical protein